VLSGLSSRPGCLLTEMAAFGRDTVRGDPVAGAGRPTDGA